MENAADALKMAFAVFMFIIALTLVFFQINKTKETADTMLFLSDETNFYEWTSGDLKEGRIVGEESVIDSLHNQSKELTYVIVKIGNDTTEFEPIETNEYIKTKEDYISKKLNTGKNVYLENIMEITTGGKYRVAEDGTRITIVPGVTRTYVTYTKK